MGGGGGVPTGGRQPRGAPFLVLGVEPLQPPAAVVPALPSPGVHPARLLLVSLEHGRPLNVSGGVRQELRGREGVHGCG